MNILDKVEQTNRLHKKFTKVLEGESVDVICLVLLMALEVMKETHADTLEASRKAIEKSWIKK